MDVFVVPAVRVGGTQPDSAVITDGRISLRREPVGGHPPLLADRFERLLAEGQAPRLEAHIADRVRGLFAQRQERISALDEQAGAGRRLESQIRRARTSRSARHALFRGDVQRRPVRPGKRAKAKTDRVRIGRELSAPYGVAAHRHVSAHQQRLARRRRIVVHEMHVADVQLALRGVPV